MVVEFCVHLVKDENFGARLQDRAPVVVGVRLKFRGLEIQRMLHAGTVPSWNRGVCIAARAVSRRLKRQQEAGPAGAPSPQLHG